MTNGSKTFPFSDRAIGKLPPFKPRQGSKAKADEYTNAKLPWLKVSVNAKGERRFLFRYVYRGKKCVLSIGLWPATTFKDAEAIAMEYRAMLDRGLDPAVEKNRRRETPTFKEFAENDYLPLAYATKSSAKDDESRLRNHVFKKIGDMVLTDIRSTDIDAILLAVQKVASATTANRVRSVISSVLREAVAADYLQDNLIRKVRKLKQKPFLARHLTEDEAKRLLAALDEDPNVVMASALKLLLLTGCRRNEVIQARWEDVRFDKQELTLWDTKTGIARHVPLNDAAIEVLKATSPVPGNPFIFPGKDREADDPKVKEEGVHKPVSDPRKTLARAMERAGLGNMRIHDIRHSAATILLAAGVELTTIQKLLGHASFMTTLNYAKVMNGALHEASARIGNLLSQSKPDLAAPDAAA